MSSVRTSTLEIVYEDHGAPDAPAVLLLHGWPDSVCGWTQVEQRLNAAGFRTIVPALRGFTPTRFFSPETPRTGSSLALAQDALDLADGLHLNRFAVVGHDWGARAAYTMAALFPDRLSSITALSVGFQPRGVFKAPGFEQSRRFWYQWFQCVDGGAEAIHQDPVGFARIQWDTWSPPGWFEEGDFARAAQSFSHPDWLAVTLNAYRSRWLPNEAKDPAYEQLQQRLSQVEQLSTPTLMIQGAADACDAPSESEDLDKFFTAGYRRELLEGIGHFPHREAPKPVAEAILNHLKQNP
jgi:pimeloyl-ACP methyl ester carboxylesterase